MSNKNAEEFKIKEKPGYLRLFITGFTMGAADLIPGVSGGTIAFLSGIYQDLLESIKIVSGKALKLVLKGRIKAAIEVIPFKFLVPLASGLGTALFSLSKILSWLLKDYPIFIWSFFFGLVIASTIIVGKRIKKWSLTHLLLFCAAALGAYFLVGMVPVETPNNLLFIFGSGVLAICAMILPGISGSFILLLLGKYQQILGAVNQRDILTLIVFAGGCAVGISVFSRFLTWLFAKHHDVSVAVLAGFMLGSVRKLWPWKEVVLTRVNSHGEIVPVLENNILPSGFNSSVITALVLCAAAIAFVLYLEKLQLVKEQDQV